MGAGVCVPVQNGQPLDVTGTKIHPIGHVNKEETVALLSPSLIHTLVDDIWTQYDSDGNGVLDSDEFSILVAETMSKQGHHASVPTGDEIEELLQMADEDGDGTITREEFETMMAGLMVMPQSDRDEMAELSTPFCKLIIFVESLITQASTIRKEQEGKKVEEEKEIDNDRSEQQLKLKRPLTPREYYLPIGENRVESPAPVASSLNECEREEKNANNPGCDQAMNERPLTPKEYYLPIVDVHVERRRETPSPPIHVSHECESKVLKKNTPPRYSSLDEGKCTDRKDSWEPPV